MFNFKDMISFCEQPHLYAKQPISFRLGGDLYSNITSIDPRMERWPSQDLKLRFMKYAIGSQDELGNPVPPQNFYFIDDEEKTFEVMMGKQNIVQPTNTKPPKHLIMPGYWYQFGQFRNSNDDFIDNTDLQYSIKQLAIA